jgi:flagellar hook-associated protein 3 FlgL
MLNRIATATNQQIAINSLQSRQASLAETQKQISSGDKYSTFAAIAKDGETRRIADFESVLSQITSYKQNNTVLSSRLNTMDNTLSALEDINTKAIAAIALERSANSQNNPLRQQLEAFLQQIEGQLNVNTDGRYLFAGAATGNKPVDSLVTSNLDSVTGEPNDGYYKGDDATLSQAVSADVVIQYNIKANHPTFQKLIGALHLAIKAESTGNDAGLASAVDIANSAQKDLVNMRGLLGANAATIEHVTTQHNNFQTYYKNVLDGITGTDVAAASISLSLDQAVLTASFQAFAGTSRLSLVSFLK